MKSIFFLGFKLASVLAVLVLFLYGSGVYLNNRDVDFPQNTHMQQQLNRSIDWLVTHQDEALNQINPMLWWMLYEVQKIRPDERIDTLLQQYFRKHSQVRRSAWGPLFDGSSHFGMGADAVQGLPYYNQHFIYALNCANDIAEQIPQVAQQNEAGFCHQAAFIYRPACITHQLMGINFLFTQKCNLLPNIDQVSQSLQRDIALQLRWDIRVVDVYLQRVLMLLITGAEASVKPVWIQQVLDHQLADGGWGDFDPLIMGESSKGLGFSSRIISVGQARSSFHATAQGVYILSYLLSGRE